MDRLKAQAAIHKANKRRLHRRAGVVGTGVGYKWVAGKQTKQPAILVFVEKKLSPRRLFTKYAAIDLIPEEIGGLPTDVIEVGRITKQGYRDRVRPLRPGYSIGHGDVTAGSIGGFFLDRDNDVVLLSNNHIIACENKAKIGDLIYQPGPADFLGNKSFRGWIEPLSKLPYIGTLKQFVYLKSRNNVQDSAIVRIPPGFLAECLIDARYPKIDQPIHDFGEPLVGMKVQKCGRTTGHTTGTIMALHASFTIAYDFGEAAFDDCIVITGMSQGGDSGSLVCDMKMNAVGLLFSGSPRVTLANPLSPVIKQYGLCIWAKCRIPAKRNTKRRTR